MRRRTVRTTSRHPRKRLLALPSAAASMVLIMATPASASLIWNGDASNGSAAFGTFLCDDPSYVYTPDWGDGRGMIWGFTKVAGSDRCEAHNVRVGGSEYNFQPGRAYWFGWESMTKTGNAQTVFQWKSNGTNDQHEQNYPVIMKVEDSKLKVWYVAPGEQWISVGSANWAPAAWHKIKLGINAQSGTSGSIEVWLDGQRIVNHGNARTWDVLGNKPRWGTYGSTISGVESVNWINDLKMGTTSGDV
ncbi:heparin lyase I family protein [Streptomyces formicae]|uniref:Heparin lyase I family protein n=1 Tax=Streptomyces formicae TaxID=1616117 RepID=A0ABY3WNQ1_9ACTN|nr:heparin lyase I family protein [Streptomyces formicae]UNM12141.1 heparin lyase I family protein [Streptomyces formicae]